MLCNNYSIQHTHMDMKYIFHTAHNVHCTLAHQRQNEVCMLVITTANSWLSFRNNHIFWVEFFHALI